MCIDKRVFIFYFFLLGYDMMPFCIVVQEGCNVLYLCFWTGWISLKVNVCRQDWTGVCISGMSDVNCEWHLWLAFMVMSSSE